MPTSPSDVGFPDGPRSELDRALESVVASAHGVQRTQGRLRNLLRANAAISSESELPTVLRRIVEAAIDLIGAKYGAMGVLAPDGSLEQFIHVGMWSDDAVAAIGRVPEGRGLLGVLTEEGRPIRLRRVLDEPRAAGFPPRHPHMDSFLGVPIRVRGEAYGNLYLAEHASCEFTAEDEELVLSLAVTAGAAIDHARLLDESRRRQLWSAASAEITSALLSSKAQDSLAILADRVAMLADADLVCVSLPVSATSMVIEVARGAHARHFTGRIFDVVGSVIGRAFDDRAPVQSDSESVGRVDPDITFGPTMAVPLIVSEAPLGVLTVLRLPGRARFSSADLEMAGEFAAQASVALRLVAAQLDRERLALLGDRGRIARDLHDHVIQRLFGAGLGLQSIARTVAEPAARAGIEGQVDALDAAIADIRTAIFAMTAVSDLKRPAVRRRIIDLIAENACGSAGPPRLTFSGPVDLLVPSAMIDDLVAVVREGLANVTRHAGAKQTRVSVAVVDSSVVIEIEDDGVGIDPAHVGVASGTDNLATRAASWGGSMTLEPIEPSGTVLTWRAPLDGSAAA